jgi:3-(3-hydroxy-phenyl)propionate hydroxylase
MLAMNSYLADPDQWIAIFKMPGNGRGAEALDRYALQRRAAAVEHVQAGSIRNKRQLEEQDPGVRRRNFEHLQRVASTPELSLEFLRNSSMIASVRTP